MNMKSPFKFIKNRFKDLLNFNNSKKKQLNNSSTQDFDNFDEILNKLIVEIELNRKLINDLNVKCNALDNKLLLIQNKSFNNSVNLLNSMILYNFNNGLENLDNSIKNYVNNNNFLLESSIKRYIDDKFLFFELLYDLNNDEK